MDSIEFSNPPNFGSLIVKNCSGDSTIYNPPFISPMNYTINNIYSSYSQNCSVYAYFTNDVVVTCPLILLLSQLCPGPCLASIPTFTGVTCYGGSDAAISGVPGGNDGPPWIVQLINGNYTNILDVDSNVVSSFLFDSLSAGTYVIRSLDTAGCYADTMITVPDGFLW